MQSPFCRFLHETRNTMIHLSFHSGTWSGSRLLGGWSRFWTWGLFNQWTLVCLAKDHTTYYDRLDEGLVIDHEATIINGKSHNQELLFWWKVMRNVSFGVFNDSIGMNNQREMLKVNFRLFCKIVIFLTSVWRHILIQLVDALYGHFSKFTCIFLTASFIFLNNKIYF